MATVNAANVYMGAPDQETTGAIFDAPTTATAPTDTSSTLTGFSSSGYVDENGVKLTTSLSTKDIKDWSGAVIRKVLESFSGEVSFSELEMSYESMCHSFGSDHVTKTAATSTAGTKLKISLGAHMAPECSWAFKMKDGDRRILVYLPRAQVADGIEMTFKAGDAVVVPIKLACYPDASGESIYIFTDDGVKASA